MGRWAGSASVENRALPLPCSKTQPTAPSMVVTLAPLALPHPCQPLDPAPPDPCRPLDSAPPVRGGPAATSSSSLSERKNARRNNERSFSSEPGMCLNVVETPHPHPTPRPSPTSSQIPPESQGGRKRRPVIRLAQYLYKCGSFSEMLLNQSCERMAVLWLALSPLSNIISSPPLLEDIIHDSAAPFPPPSLAILQNISILDATDRKSVV